MGYNRIMKRTDLIDAAKELPILERWELIDHLIESVAADESASDSPELVAELDRRYEAHLKNPQESEPWEVVRARIERSLDEARRRRSS